MNYDFDLGPWSREISTQSAESQTWFDRGLNWIYGYNHEEAIPCFRRALETDPGCAMAWWGIAYAAGPFYNRVWRAFSDAEVAEYLPICHHAAQSASALIGTCLPPERALIDAIAKRYQTATETDRDVLDQWHRTFTDAMRGAYNAFPDDLDISALFAEAAVTCTPRQLWDLKSGQPNPKAHTEEVLVILERALNGMAQNRVRHPGIPHMYIHALEMSPFPERALKAADMLRGHAPDAGHLEHMPAHIYVLCGDYAQSVGQSDRAILADDKFLTHAGDQNFYTTNRCHDLHLLIYAAMFLGQYGKARDATDRIQAIATSELISTSPPFMASKLDGYAAMGTHVQVRFGRWRELTNPTELDSPELRPISVAMQAYGKGVAHAALGEIKQARTAREVFRTAVRAIPDEMIFLSNPVKSMLGVGAAMLDGELAYRERSYEEAFVKLRLAVERDDALNYTEPWAWMHPPRHALGSLLAEQGRFEEAEIVFREDLGFEDGLPRCCQHPGNVWALQGLIECVERSGNAAELCMLRQSLGYAKARTDIAIESACFCRSAPTR